jgi:hypothetical protein
MGIHSSTATSTESCCLWKTAVPAQKLELAKPKIPLHAPTCRAAVEKEGVKKKADTQNTDGAPSSYHFCSARATASAGKGVRVEG